MNRNLTIITLIWACFLSVVFADNSTKVPTLKLLSSVVGASKNSAKFKSILADYDFSKNPKRDDSWGSSFGVFLGLRNDRIQVGFRPPSGATNMPTYSGELPNGLKAGDTIETILKKLGKPTRTAHDPKAYYEMSFEGITVYTMRGTLFEVWLSSISYTQQPVDALKRYFKALDLEDKELLRASIHATDLYKESFVKVIDVKNRFVIIEELIAQKYKTRDAERKNMNNYTSSLSKDLLKRKFKIEGDTAKSIPVNNKEISVHFKKVGENWLIDLQRGQSEESLKQQAEMINASYTAVIATLNGLIHKIDTLDTNKFTYDQALAIVGTQVNRALDKATKQQENSNKLEESQ